LILNLSSFSPVYVCMVCKSSHPYPMHACMHVPLVSIQLEPVAAAVVPIHAPPGFLEAHPIGRSRCAIRPGLCERRLPLNVAIWA
jgi:hypothetical protein